MNTQPTADILSSNIKLVIFDLDGTLYSKKGMVRRMLCSAPRDWRLMLAERKTRKQLRGQWMQNEAAFYQTYFQTMSKFCSKTPKELREWYFERYMPLMVQVIRTNYKPMDWIANFIEECNTRTIKLVVLSDYGHVAEKLDALNLDKTLFDWSVSAPELGGLKPASQLLITVTEKMGVDSSQCLVVGDRNDTDGQLAEATGAQFFLVQQ